ncbi:dihydroorotate dehydrogenase electron transfer subunit [Lignipirellula cremea]|uniref:Dihydroorotate dehydrogenase B (NAD(+)), electron transfer subunit n=1 Tax=Lignipirellula cremea TaxID=2528010 RepID=A0A518E0J2_9BACT|nr:dihydroorotate dehydrogenase electron transfer subunit [Lignipirellula cremea]QDU97612.1 Dihydroorotate dehydrogenase B (NAD(+)), electron transfer subunit [Lignipirellula cremea]
MTNPLHAPYYADHCLQQGATVVENVRLARDTYRLRVACPEIAARILPGQFLMFRLAGFTDPLIGRPLALFNTIADDSGAPWAIDVGYLVKGKFTSRLQHFLPGQAIELWGPLGNGFEPRPTERLLMVAGGIGQTPFLALGREMLGKQTYGDPSRSVDACSQAILCYGARSADYLAGIEAFEESGIEVRLATDDGTRGHHGLVTDLLLAALDESDQPTRIVCCGPEPMMAAVARIAAERQVPCQVSLETPMACGIGICFSCVAKVRTPDGEWDYKRTCVEGPVFNADQLEW